MTTREIDFLRTLRRFENEVRLSAMVFQIAGHPVERPLLAFRTDDIVHCSGQGTTALRRCVKAGWVRVSEDQVELTNSGRALTSGVGYGG